MKRKTLTIDSYEALEMMFGKSNYRRNHKNDPKIRTDYSAGFNEYLYSDAKSQRASVWGYTIFDSAREQYLSDHYDTIRLYNQF